MNRREMLASAAGALSGIGAKVEAIEPGPLCLVVRVDETCQVDADSAKRIKAVISGMLGPKCPPILVCGPEMTIEAIPTAEAIRDIVRETVRQMRCP